MKAALPKAIIVGPSGGGRTAVGEALSSAIGIELVEMEDVVESKLEIPYSSVALTVAGSELTKHLRDAQAQMWTSGAVVTLLPSALSDDQIYAAIALARESGVPLIAVTADISTLARRNGLNAPRSLALGQSRKWFSDLVRAHQEQYEMLGAVEIDTSRRTAAEVAQLVCSQFALQ